MRRWLVALVLALVSGGLAAAPADYPAERRAAVALLDAGRLPEALAALLKLADGPFSDAQKSDALDLAARCAAALKQDTQAQDLARRIPLPPVARTCQMRLLAAGRRWQALVDQFGADDFAPWPEHLAAEAHFLRGQAHAARRDGSRAAADLEAATQLLTEDNALGLALIALGHTCRDLLHDDERALAAYRAVHRTSNVYKRCEAVLGAAELLRRQGRLPEALAELARVPLGEVTVAYWRVSLLMGYGAVLRQQGRTGEALARYREALQLPGIPPWHKAACEQAVKEMGAAPG